jgi:hypothetical protein
MSGKRGDLLIYHELSHHRYIVLQHKFRFIVLSIHAHESNNGLKVIPLKAIDVSPQSFREIEISLRNAEENETFPKSY